MAQNYGPALVCPPAPRRRQFRPRPVRNGLFDEPACRRSLRHSLRQCLPYVADALAPRKNLKGRRILVSRNQGVLPRPFHPFSRRSLFPTCVQQPANFVPEHQFALAAPAAPVRPTRPENEHKGRPARKLAPARLDFGVVDAGEEDAALHDIGDMESEDGDGGQL